MKRQFFFNIINKLGIRYKFLLTYLILLIPLCALFAANILLTLKHNNEQLLLTAQQLVSQTSSFLKFQANNFESQLNSLAYNEVLIDILNRSSTKYVGQIGLWSLDSNTIKTTTHYITNNRNVKQLIFYLQDSLSAFAQTSDYMKLSGVANTEWHKKLLASNSHVAWYPTRIFENESDNNSISLLRLIPDSRYLFNSVGLFRLDIKPEFIRTLLDQSLYTPSTSVMVYNKEQQLICASSNTSQDILDTFTSLPINYGSTNSQWVKHAVNGSPYLLGVSPVPSTDWTVFMLIPNNDISIMAIDSIKNVSLIFIVLLLLLIPLTWFVSYSITKRISSMAAGMVNASAGNFKIDAQPYGEDEIGQLARTYNLMLSKISTLLDIQFAQGRDIKALELRALQAQINPHFLYNTLDLINWMAVDYGAENIEAAILNLSKFYKLSLQRSEDLVPLRDEIAHVQAYSEIQFMRFSGKINLIFEIPEKYLDIQIPKITLQPIVENAILHGILERDDGNGTIRITANEDEKYILLNIQDNGVGILPERLNLLRSSAIKASLKGGFGLKNINQRLKLLYGEDCGLTFNSTPQIGTIVTVRILKKPSDRLSISLAKKEFHDEP